MRTKIFALFAALLLSAHSALALSVDITVNGMVCAFCAQGIKRAFEKRPEVEEVKVELEKRHVGLLLKHGRDIPDKEISGIIEDAGYALVKIERRE